MRGFQNVDYVISRLFRDYGFHEKDVFESDIAEWTTDCLMKLVIKEVYIERGTGCNNDSPVILSITNHKATLPCDFIELKDIRVVDTVQGLDSGTDNFFKRGNPNIVTSISTKLKYQIQKPYIFFDFTDQNVELAYYAMPLDNNNMPLIIDDEKVLSTIVSYCAYRIAFKLSIQGLFPKDERDNLRDIYVGNLRSTVSYLQTPTFKQALNILASITGIHTRLSMPTTNFKDFGEYSR